MHQIVLAVQHAVPTSSFRHFILLYLPHEIWVHSPSIISGFRDAVDVAPRYLLSMSVIAPPYLQTTANEPRRRRQKSISPPPTSSTPPACLEAPPATIKVAATWTSTGEPQQHPSSSVRWMEACFG